MFGFLKKHTHKWMGAGWTSHTFDSSVPKGVIRQLYKCDCGEASFEDSTLDEVQADFDKYRQMWGDACVDSYTFRDPKSTA